MFRFDSFIDCFFLFRFQIAMISPGFQSCEHTLNTLRYANRVKELGTEGGNSELKSTDEEEEDMMVNGDSDDLELLKANVSFTIF